MGVRDAKNAAMSYAASGATGGAAVGGVTDGAVYFVSDAHFGAGRNEEARFQKFREFAAELRERAAALYVVGDLFDFWIEYRRAIRPDYFRVLHELRGLVEAGVAVYYVAGNHDFAVGDFFGDVGITVVRGCADATLQGRRVHISHGDRIGQSGTDRMIGGLLRNRFLQKVYKMIHPNVGIVVGNYISALSRSRMSRRYPPPLPPPDKVLRKYRRSAQRCISNGADLVIYAHTHIAEFVTLDGGEYCNIGSWMDNYDYAVLRGGRLELLRFDAQ